MLETGVEGVLFGAPFVISGSEFKVVSDDFEDVLRSIVGQVKG